MTASSRQRETSQNLAARCVEAAVRIGERLVSEAEWQGARCTWRAAEADRSRPGEQRANYRPAGGSVYRGSAGVALFLIELFKITGDPTVRRTARGALEHALNAVGAMGPSAFGVYSGRVGVAHVLARYARVSHDDWGRFAGRDVLVPLFGSEQHDSGLDLISGAAGAIPVLLQLADSLDLPEARTSASALGAHLMRRARRWPEGWSWNPISFAHARDLTGLAHGASGCAVGLLELWRVTGEPELRHAAEQGFAYETHHFDRLLGNWLDYRNVEFAEILADPDRLSDLRTRLRAGGAAPPYQRSAMIAWCHGAPGIGLTRVRAHAVLGDERLAEEARSAVQRTRTSLRLVRENYSLCHGTFGNCELLLRAAEHFTEPSWHAEVEVWVDEGLAKYDAPGRRWPSGTLEAVPDPGLLLGDAGIGHFLLRLAGAEIPSILLPEATDVASRVSPPFMVTSSDALRALRTEDVRAYFGRTMEALLRLDPGAVLLAPLSASDDLQPPVMAYAARVEAAVHGTRNREGARLLEDVSRVERERLAMLRALPEFGTAFAARLGRLTPTEVAWDSAVLRLGSATRLVKCARDWDAWQADPGRPDHPPREAYGSRPVYVLFRVGDTIESRRIGPFAAAVLDALSDMNEGSGATIEEVAERLRLSLELPMNEHEGLTRQVRAQILHAYDADLVSFVHCPPAIPAVHPGVRPETMAAR